MKETTDPSVIRHICIFSPRSMSITTVKTAEQETEAGMKKHGNRGNFANDPIRAREAGRKGGKARSTRQNDRT